MDKWELEADYNGGGIVQQRKSIGLTPNIKKDWAGVAGKLMGNTLREENKTSAMKKNLAAAGPIVDAANQTGVTSSLKPTGQKLGSAVNRITEPVAGAVDTGIKYSPIGVAGNAQRVASNPLSAFSKTDKMKKGIQDAIGIINANKPHLAHRVLAQYDRLPPKYQQLARVRFPDVFRENEALKRQGALQPDLPVKPSPLNEGRKFNRYGKPMYKSLGLVIKSIDRLLSNIEEANDAIVGKKMGKFESARDKADSVSGIPDTQVSSPDVWTAGSPQAQGKPIIGGGNSSISYGKNKKSKTNSSKTKD